MLVSAHRFLLIAATAVFAIGTSNLADDSGDVASWLLTAGAGTLMYFADICADVDRASEALAASTSTPRADTRSDVFKARASRGTVGLATVGITLVFAGFLWPQIEDLVSDVIDLI